MIGRYNKSSQPTLRFFAVYLEENIFELAKRGMSYPTAEWAYAEVNNANGEPPWSRLTSQQFNYCTAAGLRLARGH